MGAFTFGLRGGPSLKPPNPMISIGVAAAQVGVSTSTLRKWESRHGLPAPQRGSGGVRWYTAAEVARLHDIRRRIELGEPTALALQAVLAVQAEQPRVPQVAPTATTAPADPAWPAAVLGLLRTQGSAACHRWLHAQRQRLGALGFVAGVAEPLMVAAIALLAAPLFWALNAALAGAMRLLAGPPPR